jgi:peptide/nickel transport system substrate-binding protein
MRMRHKLAGVAAAGVSVMLVLAACGDGGGGDGDDVGSGFEDCESSPNDCNSGERQQGGEITWLLDNTIDGYFPMSAEAGSVYTLQAIWGILPYTGQWLPDGTYAFNMDLLAAEPEIVPDSDPLQTTWQIRPEAVWNDGTPITANDFIATFRMSAPEDAGLCVGCAPRATDELVENIESTSPDGKSFTITYREGVSDPEWYGQFSAHGIAGGIVPSHLAEANGWSIDDPEQLGQFFEWLHSQPPEFSGGPYLIEEMDLENQVIMVPNPQWYGAERPTLDRIVKLVNDASDTWVAAVQNEELQGGNPSTWEEDVIRQLQDMPNVRTFAQPGPSWAHVDLNLNNEWLGEHQALRQAIFTAIPAQEIADRVFGSLYPDVTVRTNHVFDSGHEFHEDITTPTGQGTGNIEQATQILADAGFTGMDGGPGALAFEGETLPAFRLRSGIGPELATSTQIQQDALGQIGIEVNIETTEDLGATLAEADYDLMQFGWSGSPFFFNTGQQYWQSDSDSNFGGYSNPEVDALIAQEQQAATLEESAQLHNQMMQLVVEDAYVLPLYDRPVIIFVTDDYVGVRDNANTSVRGVYSNSGWGLAVEE